MFWGVKQKLSSIQYLILPVSFIIASMYSWWSNGIVNSVDIFGSTWCFMAVGFGIVSVYPLFVFVFAKDVVGYI
jgi:hypothetical protein